ncbi:hypothetical protein BU23DRAFT_495719 [Bimuria novae-zelandiae CBS 107.79]|uniref:EthD domain-containing protein n=1 Tax=Bimuria novae-zelandiae CBS 107.79 TaxID=1447943 RepID=A0A6A5VTT9_9PLEO|nr:hypothetical protein BU23DRAFT_495719 [Bimuria novae-zelandiae CBS 107.79]
MSPQQPAFLKQIACLRRKSNMTRKEFFDYHFRVHGSISDSPQNSNDKPHKYIQTHFFDAAFGERLGGVAGTGNHAWVGRDDMTELYFRDWDHMKACFGSEHVRKTVGPDGPNFNDLETAIPLLAVEKPLSFSPSPASFSGPEEGNRTVAVLFIAVKTQQSEEQLEQAFSPTLIEALEAHASDEVWGLLANVGVPSTQFDIRAYFGGKNMPEYPVTYKIYIKDSRSVTAVRKAQNAFMESMGDRIDASNTFIAFGKEGLLMDIGNGIRFDKNRQPQLPDITAPSHLHA